MAIVILLSSQYFLFPNAVLYNIVRTPSLKIKILKNHPKIERKKIQRI